MNLEQFKVLSPSDISDIHEATVEILENTGVKIDDVKMLAALKDKGISVDTDKKLAFFSRACIDDAMAGTPEQFEVFDRTGKPAFVLGDGNSKIAAGHNAVFWVDSESGETRSSTAADVAQFARICHELEYIDMIGIPVMPQDGPNPRASLLYGVQATIENSTKPIFFSTDNNQVNRSIIDMLAAVYQGDFSKEVYGITQLSPTSPLFWEAGVTEAILDTLQTNVPIAILPEPNAGISCPYTLAGLLTMNNTECVSGQVMIQLLKPGSKTMYANSWTATDMTSGAALVGSTETTICRIAGAQLAKFYKVPAHTTAPNSDNHAHDEQSSWEKTFSAFCAVGAGNDLVVNCGMFACGMTCSHEQLIMDEEISAMAKRISRGVDVSPETIALDTIKQVGHRGDYMTTDHTLQWLRSDEYLPTRVSVRGPRAAWEAQGSKDTYDLAREKVKTYPTASAVPIDDARQSKVQEIIDSF